MRLANPLLLSLSVLPLVAALAGAEEFAKGQSVAREVRAASGERFLVTVKPGIDRGVDPKIFDAIEIVSEEKPMASAASARPAGLALTHAAKSSSTEADDDVGIDVSGYTLRIESVAGVAASCSASYVVKMSKVNLSGKKSFYVDGTGVSAILVTAFPTKGDVDVYVYDSALNICDKGENNAGRLDYAACASATCTPGDTLAEVYNPFSSQAQYVALFRRQFVN